MHARDECIVNVSAAGFECLGGKDNQKVSDFWTFCFLTAD